MSFARLVEVGLCCGKLFRQLVHIGVEIPLGRRRCDLEVRVDRDAMGSQLFQLRSNTVDVAFVLLPIPLDRWHVIDATLPSGCGFLFIIAVVCFRPREIENILWSKLVELPIHIREELPFGRYLVSGRIAVL